MLTLYFFPHKSLCVSKKYLCLHPINFKKKSKSLIETYLYIAIETPSRNAGNKSVKPACFVMLRVLTASV